MPRQLAPGHMLGLGDLAEESVLTMMYLAGSKKGVPVNACCGLVLFCRTATEILR